MHVRETPEARERTTGNEQVEQSSELLQHWGEFMSPLARAQKPQNKWEIL